MRHYPQITPWNVYQFEFALLLDLHDQIIE